jgi:hypothetical protein
MTQKTFFSLAFERLFFLLSEKTLNLTKSTFQIAAKEMLQYEKLGIDTQGREPNKLWTRTDCVSLSVADTGMVGWPNSLQGEFSNNLSPLPTMSATPPSPSAAAKTRKPAEGAKPAGAAYAAKSVRLKRLNSAEQHTVYSMCQTPEGVKYRCRTCSRCFNLKCTLLRHVRHQHQGRFVPHPCGQCGQVFKRTDHLKVHMKKIHNISSSSRRLSANAASAASPAVAAAVASMAHQHPVPPSPPVPTNALA